MLDSPSLLAGGQGRGFPRRMSHAASTRQFGGVAM